MLDKLIKFARRYNPEFAKITEDQARQVFENLGDRVFIATKNNEITGFLILLDLGDRYHATTVTSIADPRETVKNILRGRKRLEKKPIEFLNKNMELKKYGRTSNRSIIVGRRFCRNQCISTEKIRECS